MGWFGSFIVGLYLTVTTFSVSVYPTISMAPSSIRVTVTMARNTDNEILCLEWDGGDAGRSCTELYGGAEPITRQIWLKSLSSGDYMLTSTLYQHTGKMYTVRSQFTVR